jgi:hypothetical protein
MTYNYSCFRLQRNVGHAKNKLAVAGEWLVPIMVWLVVITMSLAIAGALLGEK